MSEDGGKPKYYTTKSVAELFECHENTILKWIKDGKLPAFRIGRGWRIKQSDLDKFTKPQNIKPKSLCKPTG